MKNKKKLVLLILALSLTACGNSDKNKTMPAEAKDSIPAGANVISDNLEIDQPENTGESPTKLPDFTSKDQNGKPYSMEDIAKNDATVINLWFTGCSACIEEMDELNNLADELNKKEGVEFLSMCTDVYYDESTKEAFDRIIKDKKPTYKALAVDYEGDIKDYLETIFAFPTTIVVDKHGNIIGDPIEGALIPEEQVKKLNENIEKAIESSKNR